MIIILSKSLGVYLGSCMGFGFWSKPDPVGQTESVAFEDQTAAEEFMLTWDGLADLPSDMSYPEVKSHDGQYVTMEECVNAGAEPWSVSTWFTS